MSKAESLFPALGFYLDAGPAGIAGREDELIAGEAGPPRDEQELLDDMCAAVRGAGSLVQLINALYEEAIEE